MPVRRVEMPASLDHVGVLSEDGTFDEALDPGIPPEDALRLYEAMVLVRRFDERRLRMQRQGRIGTFAPVHGQEAAQLGSVYALRPDDWLVPSFRETAAALWRGMRLEDDLLYCAGREEGIRIPEDAHDLPICIPVASQLPHAVGLAWAMKLQRLDQVVLAYLGDGATSEGDFHEAMNFAGLHGLPIVFVCQNNGWAISVPRDEQTASKTLAQKAFAYGVPGVQVDGNDLYGVFRVTRDAVDRARKGDGPSLIEALTYRLGVHTTADDPSRYRSKEQVEEWTRRDPLPRFERHLLRLGVLDEARVRRVEEEALARVREAVEAFERVPAPDPLALFDHAYAELPPSLVRQREELARELGAKPSAPPSSARRGPSRPARRAGRRRSRPPERAPEARRE